MVDEEKLNELIMKCGIDDKDIVCDLFIGWDDFIDEGNDVLFDKEIFEEMFCYFGLSFWLSVECI